ncbi:MAG: flagellar hook-basal body complex protein [Verrucomicrobiota bacterium]
MLRSLDSGISALQQFQQSMDVIGNNIANVDTIGFKGANVQYADSFSQTLAGAGTGGSMQVGTGVVTSSISNNFAQGAVSNTGVSTDLAINGNGFFTVKDSAGAEFVTRDGQFKVDKDGYLITTSGLHVQGYIDNTFTTIGDIRINNNQLDVNGNPSTATISSFSFDKQGNVNVRLSDGSQFVRGQILLTSYLSPEQLIKEGNNLYSGQSLAGAIVQYDVPGTRGLGTLVASSLEMSNVELANQMASLITTQRAFQASARIITTSDEMLQELVNLKR